MPRAKPNSKKQKQRGVDFKKIRRKIGRKLPPPNNTTNTEVKFKAIVLPEQSVAAEKVGFAVNKKGLTLKELLQKTSHHNAKARRDALMGIKDLFSKHPEELKLHKYAAIEKLRERIGDEDKVVRKSLYDLFKSVILPGCKEDNQELIVSLLMAYIFNAMTHLSVDIRIMAFDFLDLVLEFYPPSFSSYAEKIFQNYEDILRKNQYYLQDKGKLKDSLAGLVRCLSLLPWNKGETDLHNKDETGQRVLHAFEADMLVSSNGFSHIIKKLKDLVPVLTNSFHEFIPSVHGMESLEGKSFGCMVSILHSIDLIVRSFVHETDKESESPSSQGGRDVADLDVTIFSALLKKLFPLFPLNPVPHLSEKDCDRLADLNMIIAKIFFDLNEWNCLAPDLLEKFLEFLENALLGKVCRASQSGKAVWEKHLVQLLPFIPKLVSCGASCWTSRLLQAFTKTFKESKPGSSLKLACLSAIEDMLTPILSMLSLDTSTTESLELQGALISWISELPLLLIQLGDKNPACSLAVLRLQLCIGQRALLNSSLFWVYDNMQHSLQEFYSTCQGEHISYGPFLGLPRESQELSLCCIYYFSHLELPFLKSIACCCLSPDLDPHVLFRIIEILNSAYKEGHIKIADHLSVFITLVLRFKVSPEVCSAGMKIDPICQTFKSITSVLCSYMAQMGDNYLVLQIIEKVIIDQIMLKPPLDNSCSLLRMLVSVDSKPTSLSDQSITTLGHYLSEYLMYAVQCIPEGDDEQHPPSVQTRALHYYLLPCFFLFDRCHKLVNLVLKSMGSAITDSTLLAMSDNCIQQQTRNCLIRVNAITSVIVLMHKDVKLQQIMSLFKEDVDNITRKVHSLQFSEKVSMTIEERHKMQCVSDRLKILTR
ncbi:hypothetical protein RIF29_39640 [Crotalaria pallida]|uniref:Pre-rRNA-processing protein Ipi1 N-terminal domain-containing protein n=1 Tax=Crotalaria pallida TaxID=3830 RepID=A0AAN9E1L7_CROPI